MILIFKNEFVKNEHDRRIAYNEQQKIKQLQNAVDIKHPTITTTKEGRINFLKAIANNGNADKIIRNLELSQFENEGITLEYSRDDFIQTMNNLVIFGAPGAGKGTHATILAEKYNLYHYLINY